MSNWEHSLRVAMMIKPAQQLQQPLADAATIASTTAAAAATDDDDIVVGAPPALPASAYVGKTYRGPVELLDLYKCVVAAFEYSACTCVARCVQLLLILFLPCVAAGQWSTWQGCRRRKGVWRVTRLSLHFGSRQCRSRESHSQSHRRHAATSITPGCR
jgi:hypothetical protein